MKYSEQANKSSYKDFSKLPISPRADAPSPPLFTSSSSPSNLFGTIFTSESESQNSYHFAYLFSLPPFSFSLSLPPSSLLSLSPSLPISSLPLPPSLFYLFDLSQTSHAQVYIDVALQSKSVRTRTSRAKIRNPTAQNGQPPHAHPTRSTHGPRAAHERGRRNAERKG